MVEVFLAADSAYTACLKPASIDAVGVGSARSPSPMQASSSEFGWAIHHYQVKVDHEVQGSFLGSRAQMSESGFSASWVRAVGDDGGRRAVLMVGTAPA